MKKELNFKSAGFTLLELLTVLGIVAILASIAVPSMNDSSKRRSVESHQRALFSSLNYARGEAVSRATNVSMCSSDDGETCGGVDDWITGWLIFVDNGGDGSGTRGDGVFSGNETLLKVYQYQGSNLMSAKDSLSGVEQDNILWDFRGRIANDSQTVFTICEKDKIDRYSRAVILALSGRAIKSYDFEDDDGVHERAHEDDKGEAVYEKLTCPS